jgi:hypothetical protein
LPLAHTQPTTPISQKPNKKNKKVLEPSDGRGDVKKDWDAIGVNATRTWADAEQPMPTNVMWEGTSDYWRNDDFLAAEEGGGRDWAQEALDADESDERRAPKPEEAKKE